VINNKSLKIKFPSDKILDTKLYNHFIRGYFDGDGSLVLSKNSINFKFCGTKEFLEALVDIFNSISNYKYKKRLYKRRNDDKNNYYISYGGRIKTLNIMDYLYNNCNIYLERKYEKYERLKSTL
ncbi:MAG: LAGLIDADG family homing endonuclease, partial [Romboutsia sp.]|nr:LAGLIDADG family homing endonuclease [Romboutsia sp.]